MEFLSRFWLIVDMSVGSSVTSKKSPNVYIKLPKNDFTRKINDLDTFRKIA